MAYHMLCYFNSIIPVAMHNIKVIRFVFTVDLNNSITSLQLVNVTVVKLQNLTQSLQMELDNLSVMLQTLETSCRNARISINCTAIPTQSYSVATYTMVSVNVAFKLVVLESIILGFYHRSSIHV